MSQELFHSCGLNRNEQQLLLSLVSAGDAPAASLAKRLGIKRTNVYAILEGLFSSGLITKRPRNGVAWFSAIEAEGMCRIFEARAKQKYQSVISATKLLKPTLDSLAAGAPHHLAGFKIDSLESSEAVEGMLEKLLIAGDFSAIFNPQITLIPSNKELVINCLKESSKTAPPIREIAVAGPMCDWYRDKIQNSNHQLREIPADKHIWSDMILYDGVVTLLHFDSAQEVAFRITHLDYYQSMMCIFEMLWETLE